MLPAGDPAHQAILAWRIVHATVSLYVERTAAAIRPPATESELTFAMSRTVPAWPSQLLALYRIHDGIPGYLLSVAEIPAAYEELRLADANHRRFSRSPASGIGYWSPPWIPVIRRPGGDYYCVNSSAANDESGQVISWCHDEEAQWVVAPSLIQWLAVDCDREELIRSVSTALGQA